MIGIDVIFVSRISNANTRFGYKFLSKFLSKNEISLIKHDRTLAGFWAAKEAISKALGYGIGAKFGFFDIEIYKDDLGAPKVLIKNENLIKRDRIKNINISITHDKDLVVAVAFIEKF